MEGNSRPIGVFDSGVGGLTVAAKLRMLLPHEDIVYVGDTKRNPYGTRTPEEIIAYTRDILHFMTEQHVKVVAIGCNTATAAAYDTVVKEVDYPLIGMSRGSRRPEKSVRPKKLPSSPRPYDCQSQPPQGRRAMDGHIEIVEQACPALAKPYRTGASSNRTGNSAVL